MGDLAGTRTLQAPQLVCYYWMTGIDEVAQVVFVRKRLGEVQYLRATISVIEQAIETSARMLGLDNDSPKSSSLAAGFVVVRKSTPADLVSGRLEVSLLWHLTG